MVVMIDLRQIRYLPLARRTPAPPEVEERYAPLLLFERDRLSIQVADLEVRRRIRATGLDGRHVPIFRPRRPGRFHLCPPLTATDRYFLFLCRGHAVMLTPVLSRD